MVEIDSFRLMPGEQVLLRAGSGRGKSTLLQLISGLLDPDSGSIEIAGNSVHAQRGAARDKFRGRHIGLIFQTFNLLPGFSALENVMAALMFSEVPKSEHETRSREALNSLGIETPHRDVQELSVGQQQRVAVARAVVTAPSIVLADEPTASLDPEASETSMNLIQEAARAVNAALLCTSHDPTMASRFERVITLDELATDAKAGV